MVNLFRSRSGPLASEPSGPHLSSHGEFRQRIHRASAWRGHPQEAAQLQGVPHSYEGVPGGAEEAQAATQR